MNHTFTSNVQIPFSHHWYQLNNGKFAAVADEYIPSNGGLVADSQHHASELLCQFFENCLDKDLKTTVHDFPGHPNFISEADIERLRVK